MSEKGDKTPVYKKWWFWAIVVLVLIIILAAIGGNSKNTNSGNEDAFLNTLAKEYSEGSNEHSIAKLAYDRVINKYDKTVVNKITVNEDAGTDAPDDYILLVNLTWNVQNSEDTTKDMIRMYCDDLAAYSVEQNKNIQEIAIFWEIPHLKESGTAAKCSYEQKDGKMMLTDKMGLIK